MLLSTPKDSKFRLCSGHSPRASALNCASRKSPRRRWNARHGRPTRVQNDRSASTDELRLRSLPCRTVTTWKTTWWTPLTLPAGASSARASSAGREPHSPKPRAPSAEATPNFLATPSTVPAPNAYCVESPRTAPLCLSSPSLPPLRVPPDRVIAPSHGGPFQMIKVGQFRVSKPLDPTKWLTSRGRMSASG